MEIKPTQLLKPVKKVIKPYECSLIAADGPRLSGRWNLEGLQIPYDSQFTSVMELQPKEDAMPIMYGHLGTDITFLAIRSVYGSRVQRSTSEQIISDKYLQWYYEDNPDDKFTMTDLLVLTGNDLHRIPQIYIYNPCEYVCELHIMCANIKKNAISNVLVPNKNIFNGLYYSSILSDQVNFTPSTTGSTQIEVYNNQGDLILVLPYSEIDNIERDCDKLIIQTSNREDVRLNFLSDYHARQGHSRISWVTEDNINRYLTADYPNIDNISPTINFYTNPQVIFSGTTLTKTQLKELFIDTIIDNRDGQISKFDTEVDIRKIGSIRNFDEISEFGNYDVTFSIDDIAGNNTTKVKQVYMYSTPPVIVYLPTSANDTMYINDPFYYKSEYDQNIIDNNDIRNYYISCVEDYVDDIPKSAVTVDIIQLSGSSNGLTDSGITLVGDYEITFTVQNQSGMIFTDTKILKVHTNNYITPEILFKSGYDGNSFTIMTGLTESQLIDLTVSAVTNIDYDTVTSKDDIEITGISYNIEGTYTTTYSIQNYSGFYNSIQYIKNVTVDDDKAEFVFNTWTGNTNLMGVTALTESFLIDFYVSAVTDTTDGLIPLSAVTLNIGDSSGNTGLTNITQDGLYDLEFSVTNSRLIETKVTKPLIVDSLLDGSNAFGAYDFTIYGGNAFSS